MPAPERTSLDHIVSAARGLLEQGGQEGLTMQSVAREVGVRAPSLYKRVAGREALLGLVADAVADELAARITGDVGTDTAEVPAARPGDTPEGSARRAAHGVGDTEDHPGDARARAADLARTLRAFAAACPHGYRLLFQPWRTPDREPGPGHARLMRILLDVVEYLVGPRDLLPAARTLTAWCHGFVSMELAGAFELGGDLDESFEFGLARVLDALV